MGYDALMRSDREPVAADPTHERLRRQHDLALSYRLFAASHWGDFGDGHISARDPIRKDCFWLLRYGVSFHTATVADLVLVDPAGVVVDGDGDASLAAYHIHHPILMARPEVVSAAHVHTHWGTALAAENRLVGPISQEACFFFNDQALFDDQEVEVLNLAGGQRIAAALGSKRIVILRNHGHLAVGASVADAVAAFIAYERVAEVAMKARLASEITAKSAAIAKEALLHPGALWHAFQMLVRRHVPDPSVVNA